MTRVWRDRWIPITLILALTVIAASLGYKVQRDQVSAVKALSEDNTLWHLSGTERDLDPLVATMRLALETGGRAAGAADVNLRFDIPWSRVVTLRRGKIGERVRDMDAEGVVAALDTFLRSTDAQVVAFDPTAKADGVALLAWYEAVVPAVLALTAVSDRAEQRMVAAIHARMIWSAELTKMMGLAALVVCILVALAGRRQAATEAERLREIRDQAVRAESAAATRARFLATVSHELRTPMNGVLGMLGVLRMSRLDPSQAICAASAWRSGHLMPNAVDSLLDMSELRDATMRLDRQRFAHGALVRQVSARLEPFLDASGSAVAIEIGAPPEVEFVGAPLRIQQVLSQLLLHLAEVHRVRHCRCRLRVENGRFVAEIDGPDQTGLLWPLDALALTNDAGDDPDRRPAPDSARLMVARELVRIMGGSGGLATPGGDGPVVRV